MRIPHNQQLIIVSYAYHDNWFVLDQQKLYIPGLECRGRTKQIM